MTTEEKTLNLWFSHLYTWISEGKKFNDLKNVVRTGKLLTRFALLAVFISVSITLRSQIAQAEPIYWHEDNRRIDRFYKRYDKTGTMRVAKPSAENGNPYALWAMAFAHGYILGDVDIPQKGKDYANKAFDAYLRLSEDGDPAAMQQVIWAYEHGYSTPVDVGKMKIWRKRRVERLLMLAEGGDSDAAFELSKCYEQVVYCGLEQDYEKAVYWSERSASSGNLRGRQQFAELLIDGKNPWSDKQKGYQALIDLADEGVGAVVWRLMLVGVRDGADDQNVMSYPLWNSRIQAWLIGAADSDADIGSQTDAQRMLADAYRNGSYGFPKNLFLSYMYAKASDPFGVFDDPDEVIVDMVDSDKLIALELAEKCRQQEFNDCSYFAKLAISVRVVEGRSQSKGLIARAADYERCFLDHVSSVQNASDEVRFEIRRSCASQFETDLTKELSTVLDANIRNGNEFGNMWIDNKSSYHITSVCIRLKKRADSSTSEHCGAVHDAAKKHRAVLGGLSPEAVTIPPRSTGMFDVYIRGDEAAGFWDRHSWSFISIRGF